MEGRSGQDGLQEPLTDAVLAARFRALPAVDAVLQSAWAAPLLVEHGRTAVTRAVRGGLDQQRAHIRCGREPGDLQSAVMLLLAAGRQTSLRAVINATGVVLHTNLGRAPLAEEALQAAVEIGRGYSNLEFNLDSGERGSRYVHAQELLRGLTGAADALVVNNCAAAVLLGLSATCAGRGAVISRGELVEIGGGFRIPEVITQGGARLVEVGTTNRTRLRDYERALGTDTGVLLKVHRGNFAQVGFTESVEVEELAGLARARGVPLLVDQGSGALAAWEGAPPEQDVKRLLSAGADLVMFSGDKLLGGPQAGILVGRADLVDACRRHPLCRALRVDKFTLAALEATLLLHRDGRADRIPARAMLDAGVDGLRSRASAAASSLRARGVAVDVVETSSRPGGGTLPLVELQSVALSPPPQAGVDVARALRHATPPVVPRVADGRVLLDLRTVLPSQDAVLVDVLARVLGPGHHAAQPPEEPSC